MKYYLLSAVFVCSACSQQAPGNSFADFASHPPGMQSQTGLGEHCIYNNLPRGNAEAERELRGVDWQRYGEVGSYAIAAPPYAHDGRLCIGDEEAMVCGPSGGFDGFMALLLESDERRFMIGTENDRVEIRITPTGVDCRETGN